MQFFKIQHLLVFILSISTVLGQNANDAESSTKANGSPDLQRSIGSTVFLIGNIDTEEPPRFFQLNYGYQLNPKSVLIVEAITWAYYGPLGIQWGETGESYPGKIIGYGVGAGIQHFFRQNLYFTVQATPFLQQFIDEEDKKIQNGFQLWTQLRFGYRHTFSNQRLFIEPSAVINYWPINTNFPADFQEIEDDWPNYFLFEPGLHFGYKF